MTVASAQRPMFWDKFIKVGKTKRKSKGIGGKMWCFTAVYYVYQTVVQRKK